MADTLWHRSCYLTDSVSFRSWIVVLAVAALAAGAKAQPAGQAAPPAPPAGIAPHVATALTASMASRSADEQRDLKALYAGLGRPSAWFDDGGRPLPRATAGVVLLQRAAADGFDPSDYGAPELTEMAKALKPGASAPPEPAARFDVALSAGVLRYLRHLHLGRVNPSAFGWQLAPRKEGHDFAAMLKAALDANRIAELSNDFAPAFLQYRPLRDALAQYQKLAAEPLPPLPAFRSVVKPGAAFAALPQLHALLVKLGDLPAATPLPASGIYDATIAGGVGRFQARHGLKNDGVIGPSTQAALRVPLTARVRQIELALERLRWLPDIPAGRMVAVNIAMFRLWASNGGPQTAPPALSMDVIVGQAAKALKTQTPMFVDEMEHLIFRPYWNIPATILKDESLPAIRKNAEYLTREHMEIVNGPADNSPVLEPSPDNIDRLGSGDVRLRQAPGPDNALGLVKFMFPNQNDVYMHGTPGPELFNAARRDFSHGCIRIEDPVALAEWVLREDPSWTRERILAAMNGEVNNQRIDLKQRVPVIIYYTTATVMPEDGLVHFAQDIYKQDPALDAALLKASSSKPAAAGPHGAKGAGREAPGSRGGGR